MVYVVLIISLVIHYLYSFFFFFFQAEDGIRDLIVTGVQTCALPISWRRCSPVRVHGRGEHRRHDPRRGFGGRESGPVHAGPGGWPDALPARGPEIGRASCRERV